MLRRLQLPLHVAILICLVAFAAGFIVYWSTPHGVGSSPDSSVYIGAARNVTMGRGLTYQDESGNPTPVTHYPPLYPLLIAAVTGQGSDPLHQIRVLNAVLIAGLAAAMAYAVWYYTRSWYFTVLATLVTISAPGIANVYLMAWSEAPFLLVVFIAIFAVAFDDGSWTSVFAAIATSLAILLRYAGLALLPTMLLYFLTDNERKWRERAKDIFLFTTFSILPLALWTVRNSVIAGTAINRSLVWHPVPYHRLLQAAYTTASWILPSGEPPLWLIVPALCVVLVIAWISRVVSAETKRFIRAGVLFIIIYVGFILISISTIDAHTPLDPRILSPVFMVWTVTFVTMLACARRRLHKIPFVRLLPNALLLPTIFMSLWSTGLLLQTARVHGLGYTKVSWITSSTLRFVDTIPEDVPLYSNAQDLIYLRHTRYSKYIPQKYLATSLVANPNFAHELENMYDELRDEEGIVVFFDAVNRNYFPRPEELAEMLPLQVCWRFSDSTVYVADTFSSSFQCSRLRLSTSP